MNEIWVSLWHFGMKLKLLFKDQCLVSYDQKQPVVCEIYAGVDIATAFKNKRFLTGKGEILALVCIK